VLAEDPIPACQLGQRLREALGFGPRVLAALSVEEAEHNAIAAAAESFCNNNRETIEPLLAAVATARSNAFRAYELGEDVTVTDQALSNAVSSLESACGDVITTMRNSLSGGQQTLQAHVSANGLLDAPLCLLDLTEPQRSDLLAAQRARNLAMRHHKLRKHLKRVKAAFTTFQAAVTSVLVTEQATQYESLATALKQNLAAALGREAVLCEE
jgi:hypothetical protein